MKRRRNDLLPALRASAKAADVGPVHRYLISVLLPCRNAAPYLHDCINSLTQQTHRDFEVLAVNDHSTDATAQILAEWAASDSRVGVMNAEGAGLIAALNTAMHHAEGEFIARMDADDVALPERFAMQIRAFDRDPELIACGTRVRYFPRDRLRDGALRYEQWLNSLVEPDQLARDMFVECPIAHPTLMMRTAALHEIGGYQDRGWPEDYDLILRLHVRGARMRNVPEILLEWRERADRASRSDSRYSEAAFRACKVHYLLQSRPGLDDVIVWGAGPVGKAFAREFTRQGMKVRAFIDVDPRKIGQRIHGVPVLPVRALSEQHRDAFIIAAVSGTTARSEIRAALSALGRHELTDFVAVA